MNAHAHGFAGDVLMRPGLVDAAGLARGLEAQSKQSTTLGRALADLGLADEAAAAAAMATALHLEFLDADPPDVPEAVTALLPAAFCQKRGVAPASLAGNTLRVAVTNPADYSVLQDVEFRTGKKATAVVVTQTWFERFLKRGTPERSRAATNDMLDAAKPTGEVEATAEEYDLDIVDPRLVAKDVQLPFRGICRMRRCRPSRSCPEWTFPSAANPGRPLPPALRRPPDRPARLDHVDAVGEKVVIRLLNTDRSVTPLNDLGFSPENVRQVKTFLTRPQGMILVTGPTGSGKTSTLYSALNSIQSSSNNITIEDPIEMQLAGISQMQINTRTGLTFASGLRSILRPDPAGRGCENCGQTANKGRLVIHEVLAIGEDVRELISRCADETAIRRAARRAGARSLLEDGIDKAAAGLTPLDEVLRVVASTIRRNFSIDPNQRRRNSPSRRRRRP